MSDLSPQTKNGPPGIGMAILMIAFSIYLFAGAFVAIRDGKWPWFMPPQFDLVAGLFGIFGEQSGAWGGAGMLLLFGVICVGVAIHAIVKDGAT